MYTSADAKVALVEIFWEEDKIVPIVEAPYRYRVVVHCSSYGRQRAQFQNGEYSYFCHIEVVNGKGEWIQSGSAGIVPVLPDGTILGVVQPRSPQGNIMHRPQIVTSMGRKIDLREFGPYSSLEFPAGANRPGEGFVVGGLRELGTEAGVPNQTATLYTRAWPFNGFGSDIACEHQVGVIYLRGLSFSPRTEADGGLIVLAFYPYELQDAVWDGVIKSGQGFNHAWSFYKEVLEARGDAGIRAKLLGKGYLTIEEVQIVRA